MKYLFINSVAGCGSTGRIAADLCRDLGKDGHECVLAFGRKAANCADIRTVQIGTALDCQAHALRCRLLDDHGFGSYAATKRFLGWVRDYDPDVIWLHNLHGYYIHLGLLFGYLKSCGKKILWTLHDCWSFTGHCAYFDFVRCDRWKTGCHHCPQKGSYPQSWLRDGSEHNYAVKKALFTGIPDLELIVPSHWLERRVQQSFLKDYPVKVVYNTVDKTLFRPVQSDFRRKYGLEGKMLLLGVASVWDARKGLKDFAELSALLEESYKIVLIGLTEKQIAALPENILGLPRTDCVEELVQAYAAADLFLNPSVEETFGMTVLEAICCGTEAVVYKDTACQEIAERFGGIAVERGAENLLAAVKQLTERNPL